MAVTFTPNIGLAKPDETEIAENWVNFTELNDDNNLIIIDKANCEQNAYFPAIICNTTNPNVGAGTIVGEYTNVEGFVFGNFVLRFLDPGVSAGSGTGAYGVSLPVLADNSFHTLGSALTDTPGTASCIGEGHILDNSAIATTGTVALDIVRVSGVDYARFITEAYAGKTVRFFNNANPFVLATNDKLTGQFFYKAA